MCKHHMNCVHHLHGNACTTQIKWITWTACNMCFGLISVLLYLGIQFHFHMVVFIPFKTKKAKNWHFFLVQNFFLRQPVYPWQWQWTHINWIYQKLKHLWAQFCLDVSGRIANCLMRPLLLKMISSLWHTRWCLLTSNTQKWCFRWVFLLHHSPNITAWGYLWCSVSTDYTHTVSVVPCVVEQSDLVMFYEGRSAVTADCWPSGDFPFMSIFL